MVEPTDYRALTPDELSDRKNRRAEVTERFWVVGIALVVLGALAFLTISVVNYQNGEKQKAAACISHSGSWRENQCFQGGK